MVKRALQGVLAVLVLLVPAALPSSAQAYTPRCAIGYESGPYVQASGVVGYTISIGCPANVTQFQRCFDFWGTTEGATFGDNWGGFPACRTVTRGSDGKLGEFAAGMKVCTVGMTQGIGGRYHWSELWATGVWHAFEHATASTPIFWCGW